MHFVSLMMILLQAISNEPNWADQIQAIASLFGVLGLFVIIATLIMQQTTLVIQQNQFKEQQEITKIEHLRFKESVKPSYDLILEDCDIKVSPGEYSVACSMIFVNKNALASNVLLSQTDANHVGWKFYRNGKEVFDKPVKFTRLSTTIIFAERVTSVPGAACSFFIEFDDQLGNRYQQLFICKFKDATYSVHIGLPVEQTSMKGTI